MCACVRACMRTFRREVNNIIHEYMHFGKFIATVVDCLIV